LDDFSINSQPIFNSNLTFILFGLTLSNGNEPVNQDVSVDAA